MAFDLDAAIRKIPDFPKPGILFYDITSILANPEAFSYCINSMVETYKDTDINAIAAIESRGFIFAAPLAERLSLPLILVRKKGKLPGETLSKTFDLEYGQDTIEIHKADVGPGQTFLIVDDLVATGGTLRAAIDLLTEAGASVKEIFAPIGLPFLNYSEKLGDVPVRTLIEYDSE
ncbi:adenine phosphoribosyltransferase [Spirochaetia bacterium 38H-sp]|uniref:Adenine phosphoribosyltransferase n=1 Tax=Rarispira pelagica TaxID=3141764 RepID=A0ABU9UB88_9SPIR